MSVEYALLPGHDGVDEATFRDEIMPAGQPVVLRGIVKNWALTQSAKRGVTDLAAVLSGAATTGPVNVI